MCYSAEVWTDYRKYVRAYGADIDFESFVRLYVQRQQGLPVKIPKGLDLAFAQPRTDGERHIKALIDEYNTQLIQTSEQDMFKQAKRLADAERKLAVKHTKTAENEQRIAGNKIKQYKRWITDAKRTTLEPERDNRIFPDWFAPVMIVEDGNRVVRAMRYHCRPAGMDPSIDRTKTGQVSGTYNARRDNLTRFWRKQFGHTHGVMVAQQFYENVERDGTNQVVKFNPSNGAPMLIACLWSKWVDPNGIEPDLYSFAAVTDDPMPEVAEVGHDRTVINLKSEWLDTWLNPDPNHMDALRQAMDDPQRPYYEHAFEQAA